jgi:predicted RNase H-like HicB family nuclease
MRKEYVITVMHDRECNKFIGWCDALPGLNACCDTVEELMETMEYSLPFVAEALAESHDVPDVPLIYQLAKFSEMRHD